MCTAAEFAHAHETFPRRRNQELQRQESGRMSNQNKRKRDEEIALPARLSQARSLQLRAGLVGGAA